MLRRDTCSGLVSRSSSLSDRPVAGDRSARRLLDERYARGEISRDEYERMRRDIETG
ncbi:MAG: SHOCT domain-containing protein [Actinomycetota bacterium]|nr:SHOCT domain-containing protein [Actinomycetota bacterium]